MCFKFYRWWFSEFTAEFRYPEVILTFLCLNRAIHWCLTNSTDGVCLRSQLSAERSSGSTNTDIYLFIWSHDWWVSNTTDGVFLSSLLSVERRFVSITTDFSLFERCSSLVAFKLHRWRLSGVHSCPSDNQISVLPYANDGTKTLKPM